MNGSDDAISANGTDSTDLSWVVDWNILKPLAAPHGRWRQDQQSDAFWSFWFDMHVGGGEVTSVTSVGLRVVLYKWRARDWLFVLSATGMRSLNIWYILNMAMVIRIMMTQWPSWSWWCSCFPSCMCCCVFKMFSEMLQAHASVPCVQGEFEVWSWWAWQACAHTSSAWCTNPWPVSKIATLRFSLLFECVQHVSVCEELQSTFKILSNLGPLREP